MSEQSPVLVESYVDLLESLSPDEQEVVKGAENNAAPDRSMTLPPSSPFAQETTKISKE
jgi:hypothetical protein